MKCYSAEYYECIKAINVLNGSEQKAHPLAII